MFRAFQQKLLWEVLYRIFFKHGPYSTNPLPDLTVDQDYWHISVSPGNNELLMLKCIQLDAGTQLDYAQFIKI